MIEWYINGEDVVNARWCSSGTLMVKLWWVPGTTRQGWWVVISSGTCGDTHLFLSIRASSRVSTEWVVLHKQRARRGNQFSSFLYHSWKFYVTLVVSTIELTICAHSFGEVMSDEWVSCGASIYSVWALQLNSRPLRTSLTHFKNLTIREKIHHDKTRTLLTIMGALSRIH